MPTVNRQIRLKARPNAAVGPEHFVAGESPIPEPAPGEAILRNASLSIDPAIRQWIAGRARYIAPIEPGDTVRSVVLGQVIASRMEGVSEGDWVRALGGWERYSLITAKDFPFVVPEGLGVPLSCHLGVVGNTGMAAYFGLRDIARVKAGESVLVSAAAGSVGSAAAQLAKLAGCRVIGLASSDEKCAWLTESCGIDAAINYKTADLSSALREACPKGIDVYFDNTGGAQLELALSRLRFQGRVVLCGATSQYDMAAPPLGPRNYLALLECSGRMEGLMTGRFVERFPEAMTALAALVREGKLQYREEHVAGLENAPRALASLFDGTACGKILVTLAEDDE